MLSDFDEIRATLGGMLDSRIYQKYHTIAKDQSSGWVIELGTGQGAGTVSFALGIKDSRRQARVIAIDQFFQTAHGPHPASLRTHGREAVAINVRAFEESLQRYGVADLVEVHVAKTAAAEVAFDESVRYDVLAIDVDGMVDRDLALFYDRIAASGLIIIDDYCNTVNHRGRQALDRLSSLQLDERRSTLAAMSPYHRRRLLGKHLLTYRLTERFKELGLLESVDLMGSTLFCRKIGGQRFGDVFRSEDGDAIEQSIMRDCIAMIESNREPASKKPRQLQRIGAAVVATVRRHRPFLRHRRDGGRRPEG